MQRGADISIIKKRNSPLPSRRTFTSAPCRQPKKGKTLTFHWRGGYLTKEVLRELLDLIEKAGTERQKTALIKLNWPQAVLRVRYTDEAIQPVVTMEEANEGEEIPEGTASL